MKRYVAKALREAAERMGVSPRALKRKLAGMDQETRAQFMAAKRRRLKQGRTPLEQAMADIEALGKTIEADMAADRLQVAGTPPGDGVKLAIAQAAEQAATMGSMPDRFWRDGVWYERVGDSYRRKAIDAIEAARTAAGD